MKDILQFTIQALSLCAITFLTFTALQAGHDSALIYESLALIAGVTGIPALVNRISKASTEQK